MTDMALSRSHKPYGGQDLPKVTPKDCTAPRLLRSHPGAAPCPRNSQAAVEGTATHHSLLSIILGFKFIYYVCKYGNTQDLNVF